MQYSRALFVVILTMSAAGTGGHGQQRPTPESHRPLGIECDHAAPPAGTHWVCKDRDNPCNCQLEQDPGRSGILDGEGEPPSGAGVSRAAFEQMVNALAAARAQGSTATTTDMFAEDAVGSNLASGQIYRGRAAAAENLFASKKPGQRASLTWHHVFFDETGQIGAGEFTLDGDPHYHGVVLFKFENGKIARWREYRIPSSRKWEKFTAENPF
jgi:hypothetical protein